MKLGLFAGIFLVGVGLSAPASATTATDLLNDYNLIVFGDVTSTSHVDGKAYVGGNVDGGTYDLHNASQGAGLSALAVGKNVTGGVTVQGSGVAVGGNLATSNYNGNGGGDAYVGGNWTGSANFNLNGSGNVYLGGTKTGSGNVNGGTLYQNQSSSAFQSNIPTATTTSVIQSTLAAYSTSLAGMTANSSVDLIGTTAHFVAAPNAQGLAVFDIANASTFFGLVNQITFDLNGATSLVVNVSGAGTGTLDIGANFLNGQAATLATDTIWNFTDAISIAINSQFGGDILATSADVTLNGNEEGTLVAASLKQYAEIHYDGVSVSPAVTATPLPAALPMFVSGLGMVGFFARRLRKRAAA